MEKKHLILIGFMGSGKSTVGKALAKELNLTFVDTDKLIEQKQGMSISNIFKRLGEEVFRQMETELLMELKKETKPLLISTGGGLPLKDGNACLLKNMGLVVFLDVNKYTVIKRLKKDTTRPLLQGDNVEEKVEALLKKREPKYREAADIMLDVNGCTIDEIVQQISNTYLSNGLC